MPVRALRPCAKCGALSCAAHRYERESERKRFDEHRRVHDPIRKQYFTKAWEATRRIILTRDPLCKIRELCHGLAFSTVADHIIAARQYVARHGGDVEAFYDERNLQGACKPCHDRKTARECGFAGKVTNGG